LNNLEILCTNAEHQPLMQALVLVKSQLELKKPFFPKGIEIPERDRADKLDAAGRRG
jgi:hypothetical protein